MCVGGGGSSGMPWDDPSYGQGGKTDLYPNTRASQNNFTPVADRKTTTTATTTKPNTTDKPKTNTSKLTIPGPKLNTTNSGGLNY